MLGKNNCGKIIRLCVMKTTKEGRGEREDEKKRKRRIQEKNKERALHILSFLRWQRCFVKVKTADLRLAIFFFSSSPETTHISFSYGDHSPSVLLKS